MTSFSCFSQNLKPTVQQIDDDTVFCFTINQSREIAKRIESGSYKDSIASRLEQENTRLHLITLKKDTTISSLETKILNLDSINQYQEVNIELLNKTIRAKDRKIKRSRFHKTLLGIGLGVITVIAIID